ncbi:MAG: SUMF1/EgtB/PvdO family nonheme iron enzyme [Saprospiraceae bacterium]
MTALLHRRLLVELLDALQTAGYPLGPGKLMQVEELMRQLPPDTPPEALRTLLAPLFASNPEAQTRFYELFDQRLSAVRNLLAQEATLPGALPAMESIVQKETRSRRVLLAALLALTATAGAAFDTNAPVTWALLAAVGAVAVIAGWKLPPRRTVRWGYLLALPVLAAAGFGLKLWALTLLPTPDSGTMPTFFVNHFTVKQGESVTENLRFFGDTARLLSVAFCDGQSAGETPSGGRYTIDPSGAWQYTAAAEALPGTTDTLCAEAVYAARRDTMLFVVEISAADKPPPPQDTGRIAEIPLPFPRSLSEIEVGAEVLARADFYRRYQWPLKALLFLLAAFAVWAFVRWNERRRAKFVAEIEQRDSPPYVWRIETGKEQRLDFEDNLSLLLNRLRRREGADAHRLDVAGTIKASARRAGRAAFVFREQTRPPEYLLLIDRFDANDHRARLFDALYDELRRAEVPVERFFYQGDPRICFNEAHPNGLPLGELLHRHRDARLLLIGEGQRLLLPSSGQLAPWTSLFSGWRRRALLLPKPTREWGRREQTLAGLFAVAPASVQGLDLALEQFETLEQRSPAEAARRVADAVAEPFEFEGNLLGSLRRHFPEPLIRWIAACAVYPALHWDLTLFLGQTLSEPNANPLLTSTNLRQLARLPWFVQGRIPENARLQLIEYLAEQGLETSVRRALDELLRSAPAPAQGSVAWDDYRMNVILNELMLQPDAARRRELEAEFERFLAAGKQPDFVSFKQLQRQPTRLDLLAPENWKKYLFRHGSSRFGLRRIALLLPIWAMMAAGIALVPVKTTVCSGDTVEYQNRLLCLDDADARLLYLEYLTRDAIDVQDHARADSLRVEAGLLARAAQPVADTTPYYRNTAAWYFNYGARAFNCSRETEPGCPPTGLSGLSADSLRAIACKNFRRGDALYTAISGAQGIEFFSAISRACPNDPLAPPRGDTPRFTLRGLVLDSDTGRPISGAAISAGDARKTTFYRLSSDKGGADIFMTKTDAQGRYTLVDVPDVAQLLLYATAPGYEAEKLRSPPRTELPALSLKSLNPAPDEPQGDNAASAYQRAVAANTIAAYDAFLNDYPQSTYAAEARARLVVLREPAAWQRAVAANSFESYVEYLREHPNGFNAAEAARRRDALNPIVEGDPAVKKLEADMVALTGGTFTMGCQDAKRDGECYEWEKPPHEVRVGKFSIGRYEVTQAQWRAVMGSDPPELNNKGCDECPVERVSWDDIQEFIQKLNTLTGKRYRLPTEAEWEYAARGGNKSQGYLYSGSNKIGEVAWYTENSKSGNTFGEQKTTRPVGGKKPNELGLYDMSGNVWEWCADDWHGNYTGAPVDGSAWVDSPRGSYRVGRGGSWRDTAGNCRAAFRDLNTPALRDYSVGFRLAL